MVLLHNTALTTMFIAWHLMIRRLVEIDRWHADLNIFSISMLARRVPLPIWYVGSRLALYKKNNISRSVIVTATALEVVLITLSGLLCYILLIPWYTYTQYIPWWPLMLVAFITILALIVRPILIVDLINFGLRLLKKDRIQVTVLRIDLLIWGLLYLATWLTDGLGLYFMIIALVPIPIPIASAIGISTIAALVGILTMVLPSGFGLKELTIGALLSFWMPLSAGIFISIAYRLAQTIIETVWVLVSQKISA